MRIEENDCVLNIIMSAEDYDNLWLSAGSSGLEMWLARAFAAGIALVELGDSGVELLPEYMGPRAVTPRAVLLRNLIVVDPESG
jgi:hypothetical protein